jgi:PAS domain S-box-containing protein
MLPQPGPNPLLEAFLSDPEQAIIGFGHDGAVFLWNQAAELLYGFTQAEVLGKSVACLLPLYELPANEELLHNPSCIESRVDSVAEGLDRSGLRISVRIHRSPIRDIIGCIGIALDITERKKTEEEIRFRASHDGLTGLANYREFFESLEREVRRAARASRLPCYFWISMT